ncbi:hypothetical protein KR054_009770, partial [Drosophila jambulina]
MAQNAVDVALKKFIATTDRVSHFEANLHTPAAPDTDRLSPGMCQVHRDQIRALRKGGVKLQELLRPPCRVRRHYESKCNYCYSMYSKCVVQLQNVIDKAASQSTQASASSQPPPSTGCRLPPVDTEVFTGDYLRWPTFRDLFTAIYIHNSRLTPVEKLFHLLSKTSGDAHAIVSKAPLTNEGFISAWQSLTDRFENRRLIRRLSRDSNMKPMYLEFMEEYLALGHMSPTDNKIPSTPHYVIPHQCVLRPQSTSTKLRVVFDASCKTSSQVALNDILMVGPTIQEELYSTLLR